MNRVLLAFTLTFLLAAKCEVENTGPDAGSVDNLVPVPILKATQGRQVTVKATLYTFKGDCPEAGQEDANRGRLVEDPPPTQEIQTGGDRLALDQDIPVWAMLKPPGPDTLYCSRVVYTASGAAIDDESAPWWSRVRFDDIRLGHQDTPAFEVRPYHVIHLHMGEFIGLTGEVARNLYDDDHDGIPNVVEVAINLRPTQADDLELPTVMIPARDMTFGVPYDAGFGSETPEVPFTNVGNFRMDVVEVTNRQYRVCMARVLATNAPCSAPMVDVDGGSGRVLDSKYDLYPVVGAYHEQARHFCEARNMRLPSELEWERVARYGADGGPTLYPWGDEEPVLEEGRNLCSRGRFTIFQLGAPTPCRDGPHEPLPGINPDGTAKRPGHHGVGDLAGNVAEWTLDTYAVDLHEIMLDTGITVNDDFLVYSHTIRGGSFQSGQRYVRGQARAAADDGVLRQQDALMGIGFRCVAP